mmetsp:Transcript_22895/g.64020  ORF Transcript_22895/g.64020 Transcript_22895/m.64020 type:complete len:102 (+) Transcript_22895:260-565(+)
MLLHEAHFAPAKTELECGDIAYALPLLPKGTIPADCFGHAWVPVDRLHQIDESRQPMMGGMLQKIGQGVTHLRRILKEPSPREAAQNRVEAAATGNDPAAT